MLGSAEEPGTTATRPANRMPCCSSATGSVVTVGFGRGQLLRHAVPTRARVVPGPGRRLFRGGERADDVFGGCVRRTLQDDGGHRAQRTGVARYSAFLALFLALFVVRTR